MGLISRDILNFPSELYRRRSGVFAEVARLVPPGDNSDCSGSDHEMIPASSRECALQQQKGQAVNMPGSQFPISKRDV